jgi:hypothetical protein
VARDRETDGRDSEYGRDSGGAARCHEQSREHEQRSGDRHRDAAAVLRNEPVRRSKRAREAAQRAGSADSSGGASNRNARSRESGDQQRRKVPSRNIGNPNRTPVATNEPRTIAGIAASSGNSAGKSQLPSGFAANGTMPNINPAMIMRRVGSLSAPSRDASRPPHQAPPANAARITPMTLVHTDALSPKCGANTRTAVNSPPYRRKPARADAAGARVCGGAGSVTRRRAHFGPASAFRLGTVAWYLTGKMYSQSRLQQESLHQGDWVSFWVEALPLMTTVNPIQVDDRRSDTKKLSTPCVSR